MAYVRRPVYTKENYGKTVSSTIPHPDAIDGQAFQDLMNQVAVYGAAQGPRLQNAMAGVRQSFNVPVQNLGTGASKSQAFGLGMKAGKAIPYLPAASNLLEGDLVGAGLSVAGAQAGKRLLPKLLAGRLGGAVAGSKFGPWGALAGAFLTEPLVKGAGRLAGGIMGGVTDWSDPLSGRDISILGYPVTPYAKTKKRQKKELDLAEMRLPLYNKIADEQTKRAMALNTGNNIANLVGKVYAANPY
tara:strand:+ start:147 stop:878 length:732 start_codon:yes stop_codon:yes gene_type:complete